MVKECNNESDRNPDQKTNYTTASETPIVACIDTGANCTVMSRKDATSLGLSMSPTVTAINSTTGNQTIRLKSNSNFKIGEIPISTETLINSLNRMPLIGLNTLTSNGCNLNTKTMKLQHTSGKETDLFLKDGLLCCFITSQDRMLFATSVPRSFITWHNIFAHQSITWSKEAFSDVDYFPRKHAFYCNPCSRAKAVRKSRAKSADTRIHNAFTTSTESADDYTESTESTDDYTESADDDTSPDYIMSDARHEDSLSLDIIDIMATKWIIAYHTRLKVIITNHIENRQTATLLRATEEMLLKLQFTPLRMYVDGEKGLSFLKVKYPMTEIIKTPKEWHNNPVERQNRRIREAFMALYYQAFNTEIHTDLKLCIMKYATYILNRTPDRNNITPFEHYYQTKPSISNLRPFGCLTVLLSDEGEKKRTNDDKFIYMGPDTEYQYNTVTLLNLRTMQLSRRNHHHIICNENDFPKSSELVTLLTMNDHYTTDGCVRKESEKMLTVPRFYTDIFHLPENSQNTWLEAVRKESEKNVDQQQLRVRQ